LYRSCKNEKFWTHYYKYWELFESKFHLKYDEIGAITKYLVVQSTLCIHKVEDALKREVGTPSGVMRISSLQVEEALKREVGTTKIAEYLTNEVVEDALKREMSKSKSKVRY
jgi:hypothetical protein